MDWALFFYWLCGGICFLGFFYLMLVFKETVKQILLVRRYDPENDFSRKGEEERRRLLEREGTSRRFRDAESESELVGEYNITTERDDIQTADSSPNGKNRKRIGGIFRKLRR